MKDDTTVITAVALPKSLLKRVLVKATKLHGKRGFSRHVRNVLTADLARK